MEQGQAATRAAADAAVVRRGRFNALYAAVMATLRDINDALADRS
jgi:hypothetical protein